MSIRANLRDGSYEWLAALFLSWWIPLQLFGEFNVRYWVSLLLWVVPVVLLFPRYLRKTHRGSRRRQALLASAAYVFFAGVILDFFFGAVILDFDKCPEGRYLLCLPARGGEVPIEEYLFYILGGFAVVLVYVWADMHWLAEYNIRQRDGLIPEPGHLIELSPRVAAVGAIAFFAGLAWRSHYIEVNKKALDSWTSAIPFYYTFLLIFAFLPLILMYRSVMAYVNWRAFSFTVLYVFLTAAVWEVTLGLPDSWWFYQDDAMIGKILPAWSRIKHYPIEALLVWIAVVFVAVFFYEFSETYYYDPRPPREKLICGSFPVGAGNGPPPPPLPPPGISVIVHGDPAAHSRIRLLARASTQGMLENSPFEVIVVDSEPPAELPAGIRLVSTQQCDAWRSIGAAAARHAILCFVDHRLTAATRIFRLIDEILESPRIVGGSTSAVPEAPLGEQIFLVISDKTKAWVTGLDRGVTFCHRQDYYALSETVQRADQPEFLRGLRAHGKATKRILTRLVTDAVTEQRRPFND